MSLSVQYFEVEPSIKFTFEQNDKIKTVAMEVYKSLTKNHVRVEKYNKDVEFVTKIVLNLAKRIAELETKLERKEKMNEKYYGFEKDGQIYLLTATEDGNKFENFSMTLESENEKFAKLRDEDVKLLEDSLFFDVESFPLKFRTYSC